MNNQIPVGRVKIQIIKNAFQNDTFVTSLKIVSMVQMKEEDVTCIQVMKIRECLLVFPPIND